MNRQLDFPILIKDNKVYLDSAATSQKPRQVLDTLMAFYEGYASNVHRGIYKMAEQASFEYEKARGKVAAFINVDPEEIVFTQGTTEGINFIASTCGIKDGEILITEVEHHSNLLPWQRLKSTLKFIPLDLKTFKLMPANTITPNTRLVAITTYSNVVGSVWENDVVLKQFIKEAHNVGAKVLLDIAQDIPHRRLDIRDLDADFVVFSGHKMLAPSGIGILYINKRLHDSIEPYQVGGSMVYSVDYSSSIWKQAPYKFEAGTPPIEQAIALGSAIDYLNAIDFNELQRHEASLCSMLISGLEKIEGIKILGDKQTLGHLVSFVVNGIHAHDIAAYLDEEDILVRAGHHCAQPLHKLLGVDASVRVSFYLYNTKDDVKKLLNAIYKAVTFFRKD